MTFLNQGETTFGHTWFSTLSIDDSNYIYYNTYSIESCLENHKMAVCLLSEMNQLYRKETIQWYALFHCHPFFMFGQQPAFSICQALNLSLFIPAKWVY